MSGACFQVKGSVVTLMSLELQDFSEAAFYEELKEKTQQAPQFFNNSPVIINLEKLASQEQIDFQRLVDICREFNMQPIGFKDVAESGLEQARATGLALLSDETTRPARPAPEPAAPAPAEPEVVVETVVEEKLVQRPSKIVTAPVRSGQQVYAQGCDLIVMAQVSEGAEVIADGSIHVYGALRGRALAGVKGDENSRIFCQSMEAELLSIAGNFILSEDLRDKQWKQAASIQLEGQSLEINPLT